MNRKLRKQILIVLGVLLMLQPAKSQTPTMQVATNLDGSELEYINLVKQYPEWFFTQFFQFGCQVVFAQRPYVFSMRHARQR